MYVSAAVQIHICMYINYNVVTQNEFKLIKFKGVFFFKLKAEEADVYEIIHPNEQEKGF